MTLHDVVIHLQPSLRKIYIVQSSPGSLYQILPITVADITICLMYL